MHKDRPKAPNATDLEALTSWIKRDGRPGQDAALQRCLADIGKGVAEGAIANARFNDAYSYFRYLFENAFETAVLKPLWPYQKGSQRSDMTDFFAGAYGAQAILKRIAKMDTLKISDPTVAAIADTARQLGRDGNAVMDCLAWLKDKRVMARQRRSEPPPPLPTATLAAMDFIEKRLSQTLEDVRAEYTALMKRLFWQRAESLQAAVAAVPKGQHRLLGRSTNKFGIRLYNAVYEDRGRRSWPELRSDARRQVASLALKHVDAVFRLFLQKNVGKLARIVEGKNLGNPEIDVKRVHFVGHALVTEMAFHFSDGSSFEVRNSIVTQSAPTSGELYDRYPTTFHNIVIPGGKLSGPPSEMRMKTEFARVAPEPHEEDLSPPGP